MQRSDVQTACDAAAQAIAALPIEEWRGWIAYFLEALDHAPRQEGWTQTPREVLEDVRHDLLERLQFGQW